MSHYQTGTCPHCGAAIYAPTDWAAVIPPPPVYSCTCRYAHGYRDPVVTVSTTFTMTAPPEPAQ